MIAKKTAPWSPERADIIFIEHSSQSGDEIPGLHPMLVCSTRVFNERTGIVIGFPMTHAEFNKDNPFAIAVQGPKGDLGYVLAFQPKSFDWRARNAKKHQLGGGHQKVLPAVLKKLDAICGVCEH